MSEVSRLSVIDISCHQFPSLLGSYADMLLLGQAGADRGVFAPDGCIASDTFQPDPQIFHIYKWTDPHGHQVRLFCSMTKTKTELVRSEDSPVVPVVHLSVADCLHSWH